MFPPVAGLFAGSVGTEVRRHTVVAVAVVLGLFWVVLVFVVGIASENLLVLSYLHPQYVHIEIWWVSMRGYVSNERV